MRGCSGEEGEPRWKLFELKLKTKGLERQLLFCGVHLKKDEDCAFGSWTMLLLTTLPRVLPGADGVPAFWGNNDEMEKRENTKEPRLGKKLDRSFGVAR